MKKLAIICLLMVGHKLMSQVSLTTTTYNQDFNTLSTTWTNNTTLTGWYAANATADIASIITDNGGGSGGGLYNYGTTSATDRTLGSLNSNASSHIAYGLRIVNNTGQVITSLSITYTGEQWRKNNTVAHSLRFSYKAGGTNLTNLDAAGGAVPIGFTAEPALDFTSPILGITTPLAIDGNAVANKATKTATISGLNIAAGEEFLLRWYDFNESNSDHGLGIDDLSVIATLQSSSAPNITVVPASLSGFSTNVRTPSTPQTYTVAGANLTNDMVINSLDTNIEIANDSSGPYSNAITLTQSAGNIANTLIYVRFTGVIGGTYNNLIVENTSIGATTRNVSVSGMVIDPNTTVSIATARAQAVGSVASVRGRVTAQFGALVYVQDNTGGIPVFSSDLATAVAIGDSVLVTGTRQDFNAQKQLSGTVSFTKYSVPSFVPAPMVITPAQFSSYEGWLVKIQNERIRPDYIDTGSPTYVFDTTFVFVSDINYQLQDEAITNQVRISMFSNVPGNFIPDSSFDLVGVIGVFNTTFQLFPRSRTDFTPTLIPYTNTAGNTIVADSTLDVVAWNIEWLGSTANGPTDEVRQLNNAIRVMRQTAADIYVLEEISTTAGFNQLRDSLGVNGYAGTCSPYASNLDNGTGGQGHPMPVLTQQPTGDAQRVCMLYKTSIVAPVREQPLLRLATSLPNYPTSIDNFWASGRYPYLWIVDATIGGITKQFHIVGIHAKANTAPLQTSYDRRKYDVELLRDSLNTLFPTANIILLGDYNDDVDETVATGVSSTASTYKSIIDDITNFRAVTYRVSDLNFRSYITRRNVIDHITISNELIDNYIDGTGDLLFPFTYISGYESSTSDHLPVKARFRLRDCPSSHTFVERIINSPIKFEVSQTINSTAQIQSSANIKYDAGQAVTLTPGFRTEVGAVFEAYIDGCGGNR